MLERRLTYPVSSKAGLNRSKWAARPGVSFETADEGYSEYRRLLGIEPVQEPTVHAGVERSVITPGITSGGGRAVWRLGRQWVERMRCGIFGTEWENSANLAQQRIEGRKNACLSALARTASLASFLRSYKAEHHVFRAIAFSVVLTLAVGPNAALLCKASCHPQATAAHACHDEKPSATSSVMGARPCDDCNSASLSAVQFLREDVQRSVSALDADHAILGPPLSACPFNERR